MNKVIILDRDGVINFDSKDFVKNADEWQALPGSLEAIAKAYNKGFRFAVATNQSGIGRGIISLENLAAMHNKMHAALHALGAKIEYIAFCPHHPEAKCDCRKPQPGLLYQIADKLKISLHNVPCIGDSARDIEAAEKAHAKPILVLTGNGYKTKEQYPYVMNYIDLATALEDLTKDVI